MTLQTATNPDTGERVALVDGEWKPITQSATNAEGVKAYLVGGSWVVDDRVTPAPKQEAKAEAKPAVPVTPEAPAKEIDPRTGKPYPEAVALPEKSLFEKFKDLVSRNEVEDLKARSSNEAMARRIAAERGVPVSKIYKEAGGYRPTFNPEGREGIGASIEAATAAAKSTKETLPAAANTYLRAVRGGDIPVKDKSWLDRAITSTKPEEKVVDKNVEAFANVGESIGYSAATMVASALSGAAASTVSGPIGGVAAGMATSGALSYRASKDQFLERVKEKLDKESIRLFERPLDEKEWEKAKKDYDSLATQYGAWEAIPEAVSNALMLKAFTAPLKYVNSAEKLSKIALRGVAGQVPEQLSETITALGQNAAELKAGLTKEEMNVADAFRAQFVQSLITAGVMHGGAKTVEASRDFYIKYVEPKVSPGSALGRAIQADIEATAFQAAQPTRYTDASKTVQPPQKQTVEVPPTQAAEVSPAPPVQAAPPAPPVQAAPPAPPTEEPVVPVAPTATLPKDLAGAKPRYSYGDKGFELKFESDIDRAAYIAAQPNPSKRDADYLNFVMQNTGMSEDEVRAYGKTIRDVIKAQAKIGEARTVLEISNMAGLQARPTQPTTPKAAEVPPIPDAEVDAKIQELTQDFMVKGFAEDDAEMLARQVVGENRAGRVLERDLTEDEQRTTAGRAERTLAQMGDNNVTAEPPSFVTQPSTDQYGDGMSGEQQLPAGGVSGPIARGLDASRRLVGQFDSRDERERDSLEANKQRVQSQLSQAFNREAYPDLGVLLGADWTRQTLSRNPTPEEYQEAAYARLEQLGGEAVQEFQPAKETPRVTETPKAVQAKEERQEAPEPAAPAVVEEPAPLELESTRNEAIEVEPPEVKSVVKSEAAVDREVKKRAPGGGRKKSETAKTTEERRQQVNEINQFTRDVKTLINAATKFAQRQEFGTFATQEELDAKEEQRVNMLEQMRAELYRLAQSKNPQTGYVLAKDYIRGLKPAELARAKTVYEARKAAALKPQAARSTVKAEVTEQTPYEAEQQLGMEPDPIFKKFKTLKDALLHIFSSANPLEQMIAARLLQPDNLGTVNTVGFRVVEVNDKDIPSDIKAELDSDAVGYFVPTSKDNMVYVRGESYGENEQGINPEIVLHEAMHATGSKKIAFAQLAIEQGQPVEPKLAAAVAELQMLMERAKAAFDALPRGERNFKLNHLNKAEAFTDIQEFYAYGLTDPTMKEFLLTKVPGTTTKTSGFDTFVNILLQLFGIDPKVQSGLKDLVLISHEIMGAKAPSGKQLLSMADTALRQKAKSKKTDVDKAIEKLNASKTAEERLNALGSLSKVARDPSLWGDYIKLKWKYMNPEKLDIMLKASTTNRLYRIAKEIGVGENSINDIQKGIEEKNAFRMRTIHKVEDIVRGWVKLKGKESQRVSDLMHVSTMAQVDPSVNKSDPKLNAVWNSLSDKAKQVYTDARDFYTDNYNLYRGLLNQRIANANIAGPAKQMLMDEVRALYETGAKLAPYFPIMRYGKYWATLGKGENKQFIMREAGQDRDFLMDEYVKEQNMKGDSRTKDQMIKDGDIKLGQDMQSLQREAMQSSEILKKLFTMVDGITATDAATKEEIKKDIFTMHLVAMPEGTFRKQFMPRQNTAGYSRDAMRNFIVMGNRFANQLAGIKYSPKIRNGISGARASIEKNPNKARMEMFVNRIAARAEEELNPPEMDTIGEKIARTATKSAFIWQMTAIKSAVAQQFSIITHSMPVMWKHFGYGKTTAEMMRMARDAYKQVGITSKDAKGNIIYTAPSIGSSRIVQSNPDLVKAFRALRESGVQDATRTMDLANRKKTASENYSPVISTVEALMTAPFHFGERMSREITFMSAFSLAMDKFASIPDHNARVNKSIDLALEITKEGLFDYSDANTPELMRSTPVRVAAQYRKFQVFNVEFLCRNFMEMFSNLPKEQRIGALKAFTGTLGMTALLTGIRGTFMYSVIMGTIQGMINLIRMAGDDDDELELWQTNFKKYFENVWLPEMFGEPTIGGVPLSELMLTGTIDNLTGYDISSSLSMDFWFTDESPPSDWGNFVADTLVDWGGASVGLVDTWAKGVKDAQNGDWVKAFEKWTPAMFRGLLTDVRYTQEGARAGNLQIIKEADEFTRAQLAMQALGYKTKGLAERQKDIFTYNNEKQKIDAKRADIIKQIERSAELDRDDRFQAMIDKALLFNSMYPNPELAIEYEDIERAFDRRMKLLQNNIRGVTQEQKFSNLLDLQDRTEKLLDEETK
jgi:phosphopantetheinyl transferase (holo-ACP synthase)